LLPRLPCCALATRSLSAVDAASMCCLRSLLLAARADPCLEMRCCTQLQLILLISPLVAIYARGATVCIPALRSTERVCTALSARSMLRHMDLQNSVAVIMAVACNAKGGDEHLSSSCMPLALCLACRVLNRAQTLSIMLPTQNGSHKQPTQILFLSSYQGRVHDIQRIHVFAWTQDNRAVAALLVRTVKIDQTQISAQTCCTYHLKAIWCDAGATVWISAKSEKSG